MKVKIDIDTQTFIRFGLVLLGFTAVILTVYTVRDALSIIGIALFLALALNPPVSWLSAKLPGKSRVGASAIAYLLVVAILGSLIVLVVPPVIEQSSKFAQTVPGLIDEVSSKRTLFDNFIQHYNLQDSVNQAVDNAKAQASNIAAHLGNSLVGGVGTVLGGIVRLIFILVLAFLMLIEGPVWLNRIWGLYDDPDRLERHRQLVSKMYRVVTGYVNGQMIVATIAATCSLVVLLTMSALDQFFAIPANLALPLAAIVFVTGLIPMVGATAGAIIISLILLLNSPLAALVFVIYFIIYQQIENNFIAPTIQARSVELSALAILSSILIGVSLFGLLGGIIAIPVAGCLRVLLMHYLEQSKRSRKRKLAKERNPLARLVSKVQSQDK